MVFGTAITLTPMRVQLGRIAQRVVAADGDQRVQPQRFDVLQHLLAHVVRRSTSCRPWCSLFWENPGPSGSPASCPSSTDWSGCCAARCRRSGRWCACSRASAAGCSVPCWLGSSRVHMREPFPPAANPDDFAAVLRGAVGDFLDDRVEAGNVAASGQDSDALVSHSCSCGSVCALERDRLQGRRLLFYSVGADAASYFVTLMKRAGSRMNLGLDDSPILRLQLLSIRFSRKEP